MEITLNLIAFRELLFPNSTALDHEKEHAARTIRDYTTADVRVISAQLAASILALDKNSDIFTIHKEGPAYTLWPTPAWRDSTHRRYLAATARNAKLREFAAVAAATQEEADYHRELERWIERLATVYADATQGMYKKKFLRDTMMSRLRAYNYDAAKLEAFMGQVMSDEYFAALWIPAPARKKQQTEPPSNEQQTHPTRSEENQSNASAREQTRCGDQQEVGQNPVRAVEAGVQVGHIEIQGDCTAE